MSFSHAQCAQICLPTNQHIFPGRVNQHIFPGCATQQNTRARVPPLFTGMTHNAASQ
ncbi:hypothetical protein BGX38DRAFT_1224626 [Terfezia claveryi]|nr:hypothetical protein BGX38DRAFT_1224626 [Terfezia claveryi]